MKRLEQPRVQKYGILHLVIHLREPLLLDEAIRQAMQPQAMAVQLPALVKTDGTRPPRQKEVGTFRGVGTDERLDEVLT